MPRRFNSLFKFNAHSARKQYAIEPLEARFLLTRLAVIGDYSSNTPGQPIADVAALVASWSPDAVTTTGDNNYPNGAASTIDANVGQWYHQFIYPYKGSYGSGSPDGQNHFWPSPGNHDWGTGSLQPYLNYFTLPNNGRYYTVQVGNIALFVLDSEPNEPDGMSANSVQAQWIKSQMLASTATWKLVIDHDPSYSSGFFLGDPTMQWPFASWGATAVISGHAHDYERLSEGGLTYFVDGLGGESNDAFQTPQPGSLVRYNADFGAMRIDSTSTSITFNFITRTGQVVDTYTINNGITNSLPVYVPVGATWKYLDNGSNQGIAWESPTFNDSSWNSGPAELGYGYGTEDTTVSYGSSSRNKFITTYFRTSFNVANPSAVQGLTMSLPEDQGSVVYINGTEVWRNDMPSGAISYNTLASSNIDPGNDSYWLAAPAITSSLVAGNNVIAVEMHLSSASASNLSMNLQLSGTLGQPTVPAAPTNLQATTAPNQIALIWTASSGATSYDVYRGTSSGGEGSTPLATNVSSPAYTDTAVTPGTTYYYQVSAVNNVGQSGMSSEISADIQAPPAPTAVVASSGIGQIALTWSASAGATSYSIFRGTSPGAEGATAYASGISGTSFTDAGLSAGTTLYYTVVALNAIGQSPRSAEVSAGAIVAPAHVVVVIESHFGSGIIGSSSAPYINSLANHGALFNNASGITYPAQPNYLGLFSGSTQGVSDDTIPSSQFSASNLGSELIAAGLSFTGYAEGLPSAGSLVSTAGSTDSDGNALYQRYHNPWSDFSNVPAADNQPFSAFPGSFPSLPAVSFVVPNMVDDFHDGTVSQADTWLQTNLGAYASWAATHNSLLVVTWDDNVSGSNPNLINTIIYGQPVQTGIYGDGVSHYGLLRTIEDLYSLPRLGSAGSAVTIQDSWATELQPPAAPTNLRASGGLNQIALTWVASTGSVTYNVYRGITAGGEAPTPIATGLTTNSFIDTPLPSEASYYYKVTAVNAAGESPRSTEVTATVLQPPAHIVIVVEENEDVGGIIGSSSAPYINSLAQGGAYFANYDAITHPSEPNYLALFSGSTQGVVDDTIPLIESSGPDLASELIAAGLSFVGYSEGLPAAGSLVASAGATDPVGNQLYQRKHNPWSDFADVPGVDNQPLTSFPANFDQLPTVSFVIPNMMNDMHDGTIAQGDSWLQTNLGAYASWAHTHNSLLIVTWDENQTGDSINQVPTVFYGQQVQTGTYSQNFTHYGTLATIEDMYGLPLLGASATAAPMAGVWNSVLQPPPPVQNLQATAAGPQQVTVTWPISVGATSYNIYRSTTSGGEGTTPIASNLTGRTFNDTGLTIGITYYYQVVATNAAGSSAASLETSATPQATPVFSALTSSAAIVYGTSTTTLSGMITAGTLIPTGNVTITINGAPINASINPSTGAFSASFDTHAIPASATGYAITYSYAANASYKAANDASTSLTINPRPLLVTASGINKVYDGTASATVTLSDDHINGDVLMTSYATATFPNKNVGTGLSVSVSGITLSGAAAGNYTLANSTAATTANITPRTLHVTATGQNKVYDGTTAANVAFADDRLAGDNLSVAAASIAFADKNAGTGKTITVSGISISGADAPDYLANSSTTASANITPRVLAVTATGQSKTYDGTMAAVVTLADNRVSGDSLTVTYANAVFSDKNVGAGKTIAVTGISVSGTDAANYTANSSTTTTGNITARALTVSAAGQDKIYDGTTAATVTVSDNRVAGDSLTTGYGTAAFADKNVGTGKSINVSGITVIGADAGNYTYNTSAMTTASITTRSMTVSATGQNKTYDGTMAAVVTMADNRVSGDSLTVTYANAVFSDKNVGTGKAVNVSGITVIGADAGNYTYNTSATTTASITARSLTVTATGQNKIYDGTMAAVVTLTDNRVSGDSVTVSYANAVFSDKNVGTGKAITVTGISVSGNDAANYTANSSTTTTGNITARALTVSAAGQDRIYDGTTAATVALSDNRVAGDSLTTGYGAAAFADKNVGTGKSINVSGITVSGADAGNYTYNTSATTTASITARSLTVTATAQNKVYDGTTAAMVSVGDNRVAGDILSISYVSATFADASVATGKTVTVSGIALGGTDAGNYTCNSVATATANITPLGLTVSGVVAQNKPYDGTTAATLDFSSAALVGGIIGDTVTLNSTGAIGTFASANVASGIPVNINGLLLGGPAAGNYSLTQPSTAASIMPELLITGTASGDAITLMQDADHVHIDWFLNGASAFGQLAANDPAGLTINGAGNDTINLDYTHGSPMPSNLHLNGTFTINNLQGTNPLAGVTMDIGRSTIFISYGAADPLSVVLGYLQNGYNNGGWNGVPTASTGAIMSLAALGNPIHNTAIGYADAADGAGVNTVPNSIELCYTLLGDANLDRQVNSADLQMLLFGLNQPGNWDNGDFNYDGQVNSTDLQELLFTLNTSLNNQAAPATASGLSNATPATSSGSTNPGPAPATSSGSTTSAPAASNPPASTSATASNQSQTVPTSVAPPVVQSNPTPASDPARPLAAPQHVKPLAASHPVTPPAAAHAASPHQQHQKQHRSRRK